MPFDHPELSVLPELATGSQSVWASVSAWLHGMGLLSTDTCMCGLVKQCWACIQLIPSDSIIPGFSNTIALSTRSLAAILGSAWLDDDVINAGGEWVMGQLGNHATVQIVNCLLPTHLVTMNSRSLSYTPS